jgi:rRNA-processing protein EBP2
MKNAKFGFGGRKRLQKQNDAFSAADMSGYKPGKFDDGPKFAGKKGGGGGGGGARKGGLGAKGGMKKGGMGAGNRPGKARRQQMKQRKG